jgi:SAM-dependent methyltransferase
MFAGTAYYYARFRRGYPPEMIDRLVSVFALDGTGTLLDLGCGTGQLAVPLAPYFAKVFAVDPEPDMLHEAAGVVEAAGLVNVTLIQGSSTDLPALAGRLGPLRLVTMGSSFHWMDRQATLTQLAGMVEPGGGIVIASDGSLWNVDSAWCRAVKATIQRWLGQERRAGSSVFAVAPERHEAIVDRSAFGPSEAHLLRFRREWTVDQVIGYLYSTSFCSRRLLGDKQPDFEADLRQTLLSIDPGGRYFEDVELDVLVGRKGR